MSTEFLESVQPDSLDKNLMQQMGEAAEKLRKLQDEMLEAEYAFEQKKKAYEMFAMKDMPELFKQAGLSSLCLEDGKQIAIVTKTQCSLKKDQKNQVADWLREKGYGHLVKAECKVSNDSIELLKQYHIPYVETVDMNTNAVKASVLEMLGQKEIPAVIAKEEIPAGLSFYQYDVCEVK